MIYSDAQRRKALRLWQKNKPTREIADLVGCSRRAVSAWAKAAGLTRPRQHHGPEAPAWLRAAVVRMYVVDKRSSGWIHDVTGVSKFAVCKWVRRAGHEVRPDPRILDHEEVARVLAETRSATETARRLGCSKGGVYTALRRAERMRGQEAAE